MFLLRGEGARYDLIALQTPHPQPFSPREKGASNTLAQRSQKLVFGGCPHPTLPHPGTPGPGGFPSTSQIEIRGGGGAGMSKPLPCLPMIVWKMRKGLGREIRIPPPSKRPREGYENFRLPTSKWPENPFCRYQSPNP